jgi:hypothetical protein
VQSLSPSPAVADIRSEEVGEGQVNIDHLRQIQDKTRRSYVATIDLRDLDELCQSTLDLRMLVDAVRLQADRITLRAEATPFYELCGDIRVVQGELPL